jgi:hypothetical protein
MLVFLAIAALGCIRPTPSHLQHVCGQADPCVTMDTGSNYRTLHVLIGRLRGGKHAWCSLAAVLPRNATVVLFLGSPNPQDEALFRGCMTVHGVNYLQPWYSGEPEYMSWGDLLGFGSTWYEEQRHPTSQYLGGISKSHKGTAGILLVYRHLLQKKCRLIGPNVYDRLVLSRSDYMYLCRPLFPVTNDAIHVLKGEEYGGVSDRYTIFPWSLVDVGLNVTNWLVHEDSKLERCQKYDNLESLLATYFGSMHLTIGFVPRVQFLVRRNSPVDSSRWSQGRRGIDHKLESQNMLVKYQSEYNLATKCTS